MYPFAFRLFYIFESLSAQLQFVADKTTTTARYTLFVNICVTCSIAEHSDNEFPCAFLKRQSAQESRLDC